MSSVNWQKYHGANETKAKLRHNDKEMRVEDNHSNPDIKKSQTSKNLNLVGGTYEENCEAYDKKIEEYENSGHRLRKNAVTCIGLNIKLPPFLSGTNASYGEQVDWIKKCLAVVSDFVHADNIISATADFDEVHWYDGEKGIALSRPELDVRFIPLYDGKLKGSDFASRENFHKINDSIDKMTMQEYGFHFMTGEEAGRESTDSLKARSAMREMESKREIELQEINAKQNYLLKMADDLTLREKSVEAREDDLTLRERRMKARETEADARKAELDERETHLKAREAVLSDSALLAREQAVKAREDAENERERDEDEREKDFTKMVDEAVKRRISAGERYQTMQEQSSRALPDIGNIDFGG